MSVCLQSKSCARTGALNMPQPNERLPARDFLILPLLMLLTCVFLAGITEVTARVVWTEHLEDSCVISDPTLGHRFQPNCVSHSKSLESPWIINHYNDCGHRGDESCRT